MSDPHGYSRDGDTVTLRMSADDYDLLLLCLGFAIGSSAGPRTFWSRVALANRMNVGNPNFMPYQIPEKATKP